MVHFFGDTNDTFLEWSGFHPEPFSYSKRYTEDENVSFLGVEVADLGAPMEYNMSEISNVTSFLESIEACNDEMYKSTQLTSTSNMLVNFNQYDPFDDVTFNWMKCPKNQPSRKMSG